MTWTMFERHMRECSVAVRNIEFPAYDVQQVVIRTEHGDHELAACHRSTDGKTLILDLGQPVQEDV